MKKKIFLGFVVLLIVVLAVLKSQMTIEIPEINILPYANKERVKIANEFFVLDQNWLKKNDKGLWEMRISGEAIELGIYQGKLAKELIYQQESAFVNQIKQMIPSDGYLKFLKYFIAWFNRDIDEYFEDEFKNEIYGVSLSASNEFNYVAQPYQRMLNYHGAHDIGHALKELALVGCTSFVANQNRNDEDMIVGRNFDFYINDDFSKNKVVAFVSPSKGYEFVHITWASMIGVVSGMNVQGLTVTINAAKSDIPTKAKTPISLLAREILQYASTLDEAIAIAEKREIFVSESILVSSAKDDEAVIIEKSPKNMGLYYSTENQIVCSNHFQSDAFRDDPNNLNNIKESASKYRLDRSIQLLNKLSRPLTVNDVSEILRDTRGMDDTEIGYGNEKALNQLISHHSVIFKPKKLQLWVSTEPYQLGEYLCYDLNEIFKSKKIPTEEEILYNPSASVQLDPFLGSEAYEKFVSFKKERIKILSSIKDNVRIENEAFSLNRFVTLNPNYFHTFEVLGNYYSHFMEKDKAVQAYERALTCEISNAWEEDRIKDAIILTNKKK